MNNKRVGGKLCRDLCREWWDSFAKMCVYAQQTGQLFGADVGGLRKCSVKIGQSPRSLRKKGGGGCAWNLL